MQSRRNKVAAKRVPPLRWGRVACGMLWEPWLRGSLTALQVLIEGLPADPELPGDFGLADAGRNPRAQLQDGCGGKGLFASLIALLCQKLYEIQCYQ